MFDEVLRELRHIGHGIKGSIDLPDDEEGYFDRSCPNIECKADFKVFSEDWNNKVGDEVVYCPICRFEADSTEWNTLEQQHYIEKMAERHIHKRINKALSKDARNFNKRQKGGGFVQISMSYRPDPLPVLLPVIASNVMRQKFSCKKCSLRYSSIGAAFFCPACGYNCAKETFNDSVKTVRKTLEMIPTIKQALLDASDKDTVEDSIRQILENGFVKLVSSFQRFTEACFDSLPNSSQFTPRRNIFQNIFESSDLWRLSTGKGYDDILTYTEMAELKQLFQQRHLLVHKEGIVDQAYIDKSGDRKYLIGQRLVIRNKHVDRLADLITKLSKELLK